MNRRELLKSLAAVPLASTFAGCTDRDDKAEKGHDESKDCGPSPQQLHIILDGAFAVVIQQNKGNSILAFSPRDKKEPHQFYFNDPNGKKSLPLDYNFELFSSGLKQNERPEIAAGFSDFNAQLKKEWHLKENIVAITLPCPRRINFAGHREHVIFQSKQKEPGWMPTNHILEYDVTDAGQIKLVLKELENGKEKTTVSRPSLDSPVGLTRFFFEVGPPRGTPRGHAVRFFNDMLTDYFPELIADYSLKDIDDSRDDGRDFKQSAAAGRLVEAVMREDFPPVQLQNISYTLDCKLGGITVTTSSGPTG
jgi:hypothetical protein